MLYYPPAFTDISIIHTVKKTITSRHINLEKKIMEITGSEDVVVGTSWVLLLALAFKVLKATRKKTNVILARHSCYEFTKAILTAGLTPVYVDVDSNLKMTPESVQECISEKTLAVISINNCGIESDNFKIHSICHSNNIIHIEDATYTFLGKSDFNKQKFGTIGDFSILNFSEGKIIPVGGGGIILNNSAYADPFRKVRDTVYSAEPDSNLKELIALIKYRLGSSLPGYTLYRLIKKLARLDLKRKLSMESTREKESFSLEELRPLNQIKQTCASLIIEHIDKINAGRKAIYNHYRKTLKNSNIYILPLPERGIVIRTPVLCQNINKEMLQKYARYGVTKLYSEHSPLYNQKNSEFRNSNNVYKNLITLPAHAHINKKIIKKIVQGIDEICS